MNLRPIFVISKDKTKKILIPRYLLNFFLNNNYLIFKKKIFTNYFFNFFLIIRKILFLISYINISIKIPKDVDYIIYDDVLSEQIKKVLPNKKYIILATRVENFKTIFFSKKILLFMLCNFFKRSIKQNYLMIIIRIINPKFVLTLIDNSFDFHMTAKLLKNTRIKFIAIQNASRGDVIYQPLEITRKFFIPEFYCFSDLDKKIFIKKNCKVKQFNIVGSLRSSLAYEYLKNNKISVNPKKYDICLISEPHPILNGDYRHIPNLAETRGKIAEYTHRLCVEEKLSLVFSGKYRSNYSMAKLEFYFYKEFLKKYKFKILQSKNFELGTHFNIQESKLIIGHNSTALREAFAFNKKVLFCNFLKHQDIQIPVKKGICVLNDCSYDIFKDRVIKILTIKKYNYNRLLDKKINFIMRNTLDTASIIRSRLLNI
jgi:surface carbohydrate biosynthesis protein